MPAAPRAGPFGRLAFALGDEQRVPLRLTVTRGVLGMELYEPIELGPVDVTRLSITLPNLKFPLDLSGGVPQFRHRRGELEHAVLKSTLTRLARHFESRARRRDRGVGASGGGLCSSAGDWGGVGRAGTGIGLRLAVGTRRAPRALRGQRRARSRSAGGSARLRACARWTACSAASGCGAGA